MIDMEEVKQYLKDEVGDNWFKDISNSEITAFLDWACKCQIFRLTKDDSRETTMGNAFRGFVIGLETAKEN